MSYQPSNLSIRASSFGKFFDCAYSWEGEHLLGKRKPAGLRALLGTGVHAGTAAFDSARLANADISPDDAAGVFVDSLHHPEYDVDFSNDELKLAEAERIGLVLTSRYCTEIAPQFQYVAVEMRLEPLVIDCGGGTNITLTGTMDRARVAESDDGTIIPDVKTGTRVVTNGVANIKSRSAQTGTYQLMYEHTARERTAGAQIIGLGTTSKTPIAVSAVFDARRVLVGTDEAPGLIQLAADMFRAGLFPPNPQSYLCSKQYCSRWDSCIYHE
ncbi:PD-(D/E)XK nuclease family protein [Caballeronia sp. LZ033]|uniref:RecB family exonuclease n=1 Tax=Caballeronia sp. LZ033 TaxID=3038566 RepID=UPI00285D3CBD|nr:PD-(D/E)XK nuclease family protein [Caballeronia sp. LZ033]MDR5813357.1 PD-(D/E)XK nuclease family protein [Caballeronia sp. LZ033]